MELVSRASVKLRHLVLAICCMSGAALDLRVLKMPQRDIETGHYGPPPLLRRVFWLELRKRIGR